MSGARFEKQQVLNALKQRLEEDLNNARSSQQKTQAGATHEESRPENDKDTRAVEASYLARGQAQRVVDLENALARIGALVARPFAVDAPAALGAIVHVEDEDNALWYLLAPAGGGIRLRVQAVEITVITPESPVGRALLGKCQGDDVDIRTPQGLRECSVAGVF